MHKLIVLVKKNKIVSLLIVGWLGWFAIPSIFFQSETTMACMVGDQFFHYRFWKGPHTSPVVKKRTIKGWTFYCKNPDVPINELFLRADNKIATCDFSKNGGRYRQVLDFETYEMKTFSVDLNTGRLTQHAFALCEKR